MHTDRFLRLRLLFEEACDLSAGERKALFAERCPDDEALAREVEVMIARENSSIGLSNAPLRSAWEAAFPSAETWIGRQVGDYHILRVLGSGGMGTVYEAEQNRPRRRVALKTLRLGLATEEAARRFRVEVEVLGHLQHPAIAQIHDAGTLEVDGASLPYLTMELVEDARSIVQYAADEKLDERARLALFQEVCAGVEHGHRKGIIHRDLKPGNVLVDRGGRTKIIDFGLARASDPAALGLSAVETQMGRVIGTLAYMSPEHVDGRPFAIDTRSDVYSLGCLLCELLTGALPYDLDDLTFSAALRRLHDEEPTVSTAIPRELRWILLRALERKPSRRYGSPAALSADIDRYRSHQPISAAQSSTFYHVTKFARRHGALLATVAAIVIALSIGLTRAWFEAERAHAATEKADRRAYVAHAIRIFLGDLFVSLHAYRAGPEGRVRDMLESGRRGLAGVEDDEVRALLRGLVGEGYLSLGQLDIAGEELEVAAADVKRLLPEESPERIHVETVWVDYLEQRGEYQRSLDLTRELLARAVRELGPGNRDCRYLRMNLAVCLDRAGEYAESELILRRSLALEIAEWGSVSDPAFAIRHRLAIAVLGQGRLREGRDDLTTLLADIDAKLGASHPFGITVRMELANVLSDLGQRGAALAGMQRCYDDYRKRAATPSNLFGSALNLAALLIDAERTEEAEPLLEECWRLAARVEPEPGRYHIGTMIVASALAREQGDYDRAVERALEALGLADEIAAESGNPMAMRAYGALADALRASGAIDEAVAALEEGQAAVEEDFGSGAPDALALLQRRVEILVEAGRLEEALPLARTLVESTQAELLLEQRRELLRQASGGEPGSD